MKVIFRFKNGFRVEKNWNSDFADLYPYFKLPKSKVVDMSFEESVNPMLVEDETWTFHLARKYLDENDNAVAIYDSLEPML